MSATGAAAAGRLCPRQRRRGPRPWQCRGSCAASGVASGAKACARRRVEQAEPAPARRRWPDASPRALPSATLIAMPQPRLRMPIACTPSAPILHTQSPRPARASARSLRRSPETISGCAVIASASVPGRAAVRRRRRRRTQGAQRRARAARAASRSWAPSSRRCRRTSASSGTPVIARHRARGSACCSGWPKREVVVLAVAAGDAVGEHAAVLARAVVRRAANTAAAAAFRRARRNCSGGCVPHCRSATRRCPLWRACDAAASTCRGSPEWLAHSSAVSGVV